MIPAKFGFKMIQLLLKITWNIQMNDTNYANVGLTVFLLKFTRDPYATMKHLMLLCKQGV